MDAAHEMRIAFDRRRRLMYQMLRAIDGVTCIEPKGAFYAFPSFQELLGRDIHGHRPTTTLELATVVLDEAEIAFVPGEAFGAPGYARFSYALGDDDLAEGLGRLAAILA
jgi:aspartate/methionine/tyrosine aminotransferase